MTLTATFYDVMSWEPCEGWTEERIRKIAARRPGKRWAWSDVLALPNRLVSSADRLWVVLRAEMIPANILHEFACYCAERALSRVENPDPRSLAAITTKRAWLRGEIDDDALAAAADAAWGAAVDAARPVVVAAAPWAAMVAAWAADAALRAAAWAAEDAVMAADAAVRAADAARANARIGRLAERTWQIQTLKRLMKESS